MNCTLYFVRHGETEHNVLGLIQGPSDSALTEEGKKQALELQNKFKKIRLSAFYSSDLNRAKETAKIIAKPHKLKIKFNKALRERNYGSIEGKPRELLDKIYKSFDKLTHKERFHHRADPQAESNKDVIERLLPFLKQVAKKSSGKSVLLVTHGGLMRIFLNYIGFVRPDDARFYIENGAIGKVETDGDNFQVKKTLHIVNKP